MQALISPNDDNRIAQVEPDDNIFPVAPPLFWATCPENCVADQWTYVDGVFEPPVPPIATADENKATAIQLLSDTDWVNQPDVRNTANSPHLLNGEAFDVYRVSVRQYAVNPVAGNIDWPVKPTEQWSN